MDCKMFKIELERMLANDEFARGKEHLEECDECKALYEGHAVTGKVLRLLPKVAAPAGFTASVLERVPWRENVSPSKRMKHWQSVLAVAAALLLVLAPIQVLLQQNRPFVACDDPSAVLEIRSSQVIVPQGVRIDGDLKVINGHLTVLGVVDGQITLVRSSIFSGPDAQIGKVHTVEWTWYQQLSHSMEQMREDLRSFVRGIWR